MTKKVPILGTSVSPEYFAGGKWRLLTENNQLSYGHLPSNRHRRTIIPVITLCSGAMGQWKEDLDISSPLSLVEWEELSLKVTDNLENLTTKNPCMCPDLRRCLSTQPPASRGPYCARRERVRTFTRVRHEAAREPRDRCQGHAALLGHGQVRPPPSLTRSHL